MKCIGSLGKQQSWEFKGKYSEDNNPNPISNLILLYFCFKVGNLHMMEKYGMTDETNCLMLQAVLTLNQRNKLLHLIRSLNKTLHWSFQMKSPSLMTYQTMNLIYFSDLFIKCQPRIVIAVGIPHFSNVRKHNRTNFCKIKIWKYLWKLCLPKSWFVLFKISPTSSTIEETFANVSYVWLYNLQNIISFKNLNMKWETTEYVSYWV